MSDDQVQITDSNAAAVSQVQAPVPQVQAAESQVQAPVPQVQAAESQVQAIEPKTSQTQIKEDSANIDQGVSQESVNLINRELQEKSVLAYAKSLNLPYIDIAKAPLNPDFLKILDISFAKSGRVVPFFKVAKKVKVAVDNIDRAETKLALKNLEDNGYELSLSLASASGIDDALKIYDTTQQYKKIDIVEKVEESSVKTYEKEIANLSELPTKLAAVTAEEGLNLLNIAAMRTGASDIHYEPGINGVNVRFRIDGILHVIFQLSQSIYKNISNQIKYESRMRLNSYTVPQDGRYTFTFNENKVAVRVSSIPTPYGESFVCRFLPSGKKQLALSDLGFQGSSLKKLEAATKISQGMILVTGPTGSGKSTTLYSLLTAMNKPENKTITLEDPVEYYIAGVTQSQIDEKNGYTFASGLRTILRQDPDIIMLGEIRDIETAETAAQAALTGHILLSTLHTNSAIESIPRLINMGLAPFMVAPSLDTIVAQRLARKVCPSCFKMDNISESQREEFEKIMDNLKNINPSAVVPIPEKIAIAQGCDNCSSTGYKGRLVIAEILTVNSEIKNLILKKSSSVDIISSARKNGMITMREDGYIKVAQGLTTLEEIYRVTNLSI